MMELMAGARDESRRKLYREAFRHYQKNDLIIVPNTDDWLLAANVLHLLTHARRRLQKRNLQRLPPGASQRLALDVLIAVSARRWKAQVGHRELVRLQSDSAVLQHHNRQSGNVPQAMIANKKSVSNYVIVRS
jgi:predicted nucleic acid-binding protein